MRYHWNVGDLWLVKHAADGSPSELYELANQADLVMIAVQGLEENGSGRWVFLKTVDLTHEENVTVPYSVF